MNIIKKFVGSSPVVIRKPLLAFAKSIRTNLFGVPDPLNDLARLGRIKLPDAILDIGAHHGQTAIELRSLFPGLQIHCFEPYSESFDILKSATQHLQPIWHHKVALCDIDGTSKFFVNINSQTNSLLDNDKDNIDEIPSTAHLSKEEVETRTLDSFSKTNLNGKRLFIKADIQGAELKLISGGLKTLAEMTDVFLCEVSLASLYQGQGDLFSINSIMTSQLPFVLYQIYRTVSNSQGRALWADAIWVRQGFLDK